MRAVDTNILVYAHRREAAEHAAATEVVRSLAEGAQPWAVPWPCLYEFFSVVTHPKIWRDAASTPSQAWAQIEAWLGWPSLRLLGETPEFGRLFARFLDRPRVRGGIVHDARSCAPATRSPESRARPLGFAPEATGDRSPIGRTTLPPRSRALGPCGRRPPAVQSAPQPHHPSRRSHS
jgi:hypothetical protein